MSTVVQASRLPSTKWTERLEGEEQAEVEVNVTVAADGSGDFRTVGAAVDAAPEKSKSRYVIEIKEGRYDEYVFVGKKKVNLMFVGAGRGRTVISGNRSVADGLSTFQTATLVGHATAAFINYYSLQQNKLLRLMRNISVNKQLVALADAAVEGDLFLARDLTIENTAGPSKGQAVALRVKANFSAFYNCDILGYQDTLYAFHGRQFYRNCLIRGTVDFIFGNAAVVFQDCDIQVRQPNPGQENMVTAQGRNDPDEPTAISIHRCRIGAEPGFNKSLNPSYLGRPWKEYSRAVIMQSNITEVIHPAGWHEWDGRFALDTLYYGEYNNSGPGADTAQRVNWTGYRVIYNSTEAQQFAAGSLITGSEWLGSTGFPYYLGLKVQDDKGGVEGGAGKSNKRTVIYVKKWVYYENVRVKTKKWNVLITGDGKNMTVVSGRPNTVDGTPTFSTATFGEANFFSRLISNHN
ncbi:uncharacterized protein A4U43_C03F13280 [Asparagus officinalis]|uniref:Pectinesterase n=1 Tax=Asparagus officinalis TaxID=4686 RepID=A0A5P1F9N1_ASPOF|nr:uncharacterized protein A4U43_C03F13280 [Asparagus officinalis]